MASVRVCLLGSDAPCLCRYNERDVLTSFDDNPRAKIFARLQVKRVACLSEIAFVMRWCGGVSEVCVFCSKGALHCK